MARLDSLGRPLIMQKQLYGLCYCVIDNMPTDYIGVIQVGACHVCWPLDNQQVVIHFNTYAEALEWFETGVFGTKEPHGV